MGFNVKAADGKKITVPDGEYYFNTKARGRRMMLNSLSSDARRVYACLELATMGFQQELAVTMERGEQRPLNPTDIQQQTGLSRQHVRRGLEDLENAGLAVRKAADGGALRRGQVLLYSWAVPREPKKEVCSRARLQFPDWFPKSWDPLKPLISRFKLSITADFVAAGDYKDELDAAAHGYKEAEIVALRALERVCAGPKSGSLYKEGKNGKNNTERTESSSSAFGSTREQTEEENRNAYQTFKTSYPAERFDEPKAKPSFEGRTATQQARILERLRVYLGCERWQDQSGRWIPLASTWLRTHDADPPPLLRKASTKSNRRAAADAFFAEDGHGD